MQQLLRAVVLPMLALLWSGVAWAESQAASAADDASALSIPWQVGPADMALLNQALIKVPKNYAFLDQKEAHKLLRKMGNPNIADVIGLVSGVDGDWIAVVRFEKTGFIRADKEQEWDDAEMLEELKAATEKTNAIRRKYNVGEVVLIGWQEKPHYDKATHRLIWSVASQNKQRKNSEDKRINYNVHVLGREGVISFNLVGDLKQLEKNEAHVAAILADFAFVSGKKYEEFKSASDAMAPYGLAELVTGVPSFSSRMWKGTKHFFSSYGKLMLWLLLGLLLLAGAAVGGYFLRKKWLARPKKSLLEPTLDDAEGAAGASVVAPPVTEAAPVASEPVPAPAAPEKPA